MYQRYKKYVETLKTAEEIVKQLKLLEKGDYSEITPHSIERWVSEGIFVPITIDSVTSYLTYDIISMCDGRQKRVDEINGALQFPGARVYFNMAGAVSGLPNYECIFVYLPNSSIYI